MLGLGGMNSITLVNFYYESLRVDTRVIGKHIDHRCLNSISLSPVVLGGLEDQSAVSRTVGEEPLSTGASENSQTICITKHSAMSALGRTASMRE